MKFGTLVVFKMLKSNLPGAKANFQSWTISNISIANVKGQSNLNMKIVVQMSELSLMTELDKLRFLSKSETPNLATLGLLLCAGPFN